MFPCPVTNADVLAELRKFLDLPQSLISFKLELRIDQLPTIECTFNPDARIGGAAWDCNPPVTRHFTLVETAKP